MTFQKLLLASAIAALSSTSFAMEAMDDGSMSSTTGQDGLSISLATNLSLDMILHDKDGFTTPNSATDSGALVIRGITVDNGTASTNAGLRIDIDAGATTAASTTPTLQIGVFNTTNLRLTLGTLRVANSSRTGTGTNGSGWGIVSGSESATLVNLGQLSIASSTSPLLNIQMGKELQGSWMRINTSITGGVSLAGFTLNDADTSGTGGGGGGIKMDLTANNKGQTSGFSLDTDIGIDATTSGLVLTLTKIGAAGTSGGMDVRMANLILGNTGGSTYVGDVELLGLNLNGTTVTVAGH